MKTFNARHTVSFYGRFTEDKKKETEVAKKQKILDLNEKQFCTEYCKQNKQTDDCPARRQFDFLSKQRGMIYEVS